MCDNGVGMKTNLRIFFFITAFVMSSCQGRTSPQITEADMEKFINENIQLGASRADVLAYLKTLKFDSRSLRGVDSYYGDSIQIWLKIANL
jgi:hypothetical protein